MTLLDLSNLESIERRIPQLEQTYRETIGASVYEFCCEAMGVVPIDESLRRTVKVASVPITAGGGLIGNFADIVAQIVREFAGVDAFVTQATDVSGIQEAVVAGADIVFMADDDTCMALNVHTGVQSDNSEATGHVFAALLERAAGGVDRQEALVLGMGKVGRSAYRYLQEAGAYVSWYDDNPPAGVPLDEQSCRPDWEYRTWGLIVECTTAPELICGHSVADGAIVSAPGIPFGLTLDACAKTGLVIHDELESGIIAMLCEVM